MAPSRTAVSANCAFTVKREKAKSLFSTINRYRASKNISTLTWDDTLYSYCVLHNIDMHGSNLKSSNFSLGHGYNENVAHVPGRPKKVLDVWHSRSKEKENLLFDCAKYSAIAVYGDENECYATQIFMDQRPKKNDKVVSMKTQKKCDTCKSGYTIVPRGMSSVGLKAKSAASMKLRAKSSQNQSLLKNVGTMGKSIRNSIASGMQSLGEALDDMLPSASQPPPRMDRLPGTCRGGIPMSCPHSLPYTFDRGSRPKASARRPSIPRNGFSCSNCRREDNWNDSFEDCPLCKHRRCHRVELCDRCSRYM